jgi:hypothetical protein
MATNSTGYLSRAYATANGTIYLWTVILAPQLRRRAAGSTSGHLLITFGLGLLITFGLGRRRFFLRQEVTHLIAKIILDSFGTTS